MIETSPTVPAEQFAPQYFEKATRFPHGMYPTHQGIETLIAGSCSRLQVSPWNLAGLLGLPDQNLVYRWKNQKGRPSALFLSRLCLLLAQWTPDIDWKAIRFIDWTTGIIHFRNGSATQGGIELAGRFDPPRPEDPWITRSKSLKKRGQMAKKSKSPMVVPGRRIE